MLSSLVVLATYGHENLSDLKKIKLEIQLIAVATFHVFNGHMHEG